MPGKRAEGVTVRNISIEDDLWAAAKAKAASEGRSLSAVIRELLREWLSK
ncbi:ribbon-helix-helix protein, CopG family [Microbispora sp. SCL1-1]|nr:MULTISPECIES: ribbon-helix-helix protein, CopG family [unclassified Microbispora]NJP24420.1 ribbon-helix-helix protein, CopG family [Microbispora sp. CL1-1]TQS14570.1 ribbon-helix-helix protein, CopG family [Microbispora sp. SCL1-1]